MAYRNSSWCPDPTAGQAMGHIIKEDRRKRNRLTGKKRQRSGKNKPVFRLAWQADKPESEKLR